MREYKGSEIRNIAVVGHGASGKTSLVDALAFVSGSSKRHGSVKDGTALTDTAAEEVERGYSINLGCAFAEWQDTKINLLDTPGYLDFQGDAVAGLAAADGALCVVPATAGVEVGTERMFKEAMRRRDPVLFVVSMMDKEHADFDRIYQQIKTRLTNKVIPIEIPVGQGRYGPIGSCWDRYYVRVEEMRQCVRILHQALDKLPAEGDVHEKVPKRVKPNPGEAYARTETPRGELAFYIVSDGGLIPYRVKGRSPCFVAMGLFHEIARGEMIADIIAIIGSLDIVLGEIDR